MAQHDLVSIPASHFCERARWALDYAGICYTEHKWPPLLHLLGTLPTSGTRTVPVLKCSHILNRKAKLITDSKDIVRYANERILERTSPETDNGPSPTRLPLYPSDLEQLKEVERLEEIFANKLGVWTRVVAYYYLFQDRNTVLDVLARRQQRAPAVGSWKSAWLRAFYPLVRAAISKGFGADAQGAATCLNRIRAMFDEVGQLLHRNGGQYLVGDRFTAADLTFAAMAAIVLLPDQYGAYLPSLDAWAPDAPARELRDTPAGRHALRMYALHRA